MQNRYRIYRRGRGSFYVKDRITGKAESLCTADRAAAQLLLAAKNQAVIQPQLNRAMARTYLMANWIAAAFTPAPDRTLEQRTILELSDELIEELKRADHYVFGVPMYNFAPPAALKLWLDQVVRVGKTYQNVAGKREGLLSAKQVVIYVASGGTYEAESPTAPFDFITPYLRAILSYIGLNAVRFYSAGGTKILLGKTTTREAFLAPHLDEIRSGMSS